MTPLVQYPDGRWEPLTWNLELDGWMIGEEGPYEMDEILYGLGAQVIELTDKQARVKLLQQSLGPEYVVRLEMVDHEQAVMAYRLVPKGSVPSITED